MITLSVTAVIVPPDSVSVRLKTTTQSLPEVEMSLIVLVQSFSVAPPVSE